MNTIKIYNDDCFNVFREMIQEDVKVDLVLTDPPYNITANRWDTSLDLKKMWEKLEQLIKYKGNILLFSSGMFTHQLALSNPKMYRYELIWKKSKCGSPFTAKYMPLKKHENILVFGESASYYKPQMTEGEPYKRNFTSYKTNNMEYGVKGCKTDNKGTRHPTSVLDYPQKWRRQDQLHPTQKPVELLEFLVKSYCKENGIVLDFCMGSGSTGVACLNTNRRFIGVEIEKEYYDIARQRIRNHEHQTI